MSKSIYLRNAYLQLLFNATAIANIANNATTAPLTNLFVSLHTGDPGGAGTQAVNEIAYTGYARVAVARSSLGWSVVGTTVKPVNDINFPVPTAVGGTVIATHMSIGVAVSGASSILYSAMLDPSIQIAVGVVPKILSTSLISEY